MIRYFLLLPMLIVYGAAFGQTYNHELAIDVSPLIKKETTLGFVYRYHMQGGAIRAFAAYSNDSRDGDSNLVNTAIVSNTQNNTMSASYSNVSLRLGWQKNFMMDQWMVYGGVDAVYSLIKNSYDYSSYTPASFGDTRIVYSRTNRTSQYGVAPVFGFGYSVNPRFFVSFETGFSYLFYREDNTSKQQDYFYDNNGKETLNNTADLKTTSDGKKMDFSLANQFRFYIGFRF